ncbi:MAG: cyclic nucleotide-binding domain-containing protein [Pseudomonadota bacterium]
MQKSFATGDILFREGDDSDVVYRITSGRVAVIKERPGAPLVLGRVREGEFLGEMGVVEDQPRSATAQAETPVEAEVYEASDFMNLVCEDSTLALNLIRRLSIRLRNLDRHVARLLPSRKMTVDRRRSERPEATPAAQRSVAIRGGTYALKLYIGTAPIDVPKMPYTVGRVPEKRQEDSSPEPDLGILDPSPYRLSPAHFVLFEDYGKIFIRDCNSEYGTVVNDRNLGRDFAVDQVALRAGENTVIAGGDGSPYKFLIDV